MTTIFLTLCSVNCILHKMCSFIYKETWLTQAGGGLGIAGMDWPESTATESYSVVLHGLCRALQISLLQRRWTPEWRIYMLLWKWYRHLVDMFRSLVDGLVIFKLNVVRVRVRVSTYLILIKSMEIECVRKMYGFKCYWQWKQTYFLSVWSEHHLMGIINVFVHEELNNIK